MSQLQECVTGLARKSIIIITICLLIQRIKVLKPFRGRQCCLFSINQLSEIKFATRQWEKPSQQGLKRNISRPIFKLFAGKAFVLSKYSPVTLHHSPAILQFLMKPLFCAQHINLIHASITQQSYPHTFTILSYIHISIHFYYYNYSLNSH